MRENAILERILGLTSDLLNTLSNDLISPYPKTCSATHKKLHTTPHF